MNPSIGSATIAVSTVSHPREPDRGSSDDTTLHRNAAAVTNAVQDLPGIRTNANRANAGAFGRRLLSLLPNNKFHLRDNLYKNLSAVLHQIGDQAYGPEDNQARHVLQLFADQIGMGPQWDGRALHACLQVIRQSLVEEGRQQYARDDRLRAIMRTSARHTRMHPANATVERNDDVHLSKGIRELRKQGHAVQLGKQIRQFLVELGADAARIGHTIPNA